MAFHALLPQVLVTVPVAFQRVGDHPLVLVDCLVSCGGGFGLRGFRAAV
jgi:hypothetical protein